jgi:hypothetical protein
MAIEFRDNPNTTLPELQQELKRVVGQVRSPEVIKGVQLLAGADTAVAHGQRYIPRSFSVTPYSQIGYWKRGALGPDKNCVYVFVDVATVADIIVFP